MTITKKLEFLSCENDTSAWELFNGLKATLFIKIEINSTENKCFCGQTFLAEYQLLKSLIQNKYDSLTVCVIEVFSF
jgi:hypothetical protein